MQIQTLPARIFLIIFLTTLLAGCSGDKTVYENYHKFDDVSWNRFDFMEYKVELTDVESAYDIFLALRHIPEISYEELVVSFTIFSPSGSMRSANYTLNLVDNDDRRLSECMGDLCDIVLPLREEFTITEPGIFKFEIENKYPKIEMPGIIEVGLVVKKSSGDE